MRRSLVVAAALALPLSLLFVSPAAAVDYDCADFAWQEDAQAVFDRYPGDPHGLDADGDRIACESLPSRGSAPSPLPYSHNFTADSAPDVVAARSDGALILYPGNRRGGFQSTYPRIGSGWQARDIILHAQDFDRTGSRDIMARDPADGNLWFYRGNGSGGISAQ